MGYPLNNTRLKYNMHLTDTNSRMDFNKNDIKNQIRKI